MERCRLSLLIVMLSVSALAGTVLPAGAQTLTLSTGSGIAITGSNPDWSGSVGVVNGLGIGTPAAGVSVETTGVTGGVFYTTPVDFVLSGISQGLGNQSEVWGHVSQTFSNTAVQVRYCYPVASCTGYSSYLPISAVAMQTKIIPGPANAGTYTVSIGVFVSNTNGPGTVTGLTSSAITLQTVRTSNLSLRDTDTLTLTSTVQSAIRLLLATAGGVTISPASNYSTSFGSVNGLGIGPAAGLTPTTVSGGSLYSTPYGIVPSFSGFSSSTANVTAYVSLDFAHPAILELRHSANGSFFAAFSKLPASPTSVGSALTNGVSITRYLGLFVSSLNGTNAFTGADRVVVTFTVVNQ